MMLKALIRPLLALALAALLPLAASAQQAGSALPGRDQLAQAGSGHWTVSFENHCSETVYLYVHYLPPQQAAWSDAGPVSLPPDARKTIFRTDNRIYYYYAADKARTWDGEMPRRLPGSLIQVNYREKRIESDTPGQTVVISCSSSYDQTGQHRIRIFNNCSRPYRVMLHYDNLDEGWKTEGWWTLEPYETRELRKTRSPHYYLVAEAEDRPQDFTTFTGPHEFTYRGRTYRMVKTGFEHFFTALLC
ncbi:DUF1036 domain-containing protein [Pseudooceanicola sp. HF7]|uniref:DUF1036 domain-containing protein n=1 Tax=Pseudooceanicola sp. HF7 TaxID=2721560 RepID=UPI00143185C7|nr:DUF1036 domain-containing protein [Pseudooceanicola sp. HF7]NIZ11661.1 DUF1036 domain-containing protein [Pseudooceanicola sp. HF7]